ncbi:heme exporter protein CcmD [Aquirhabdus parva]|uniref:Heme exporter protein D n=1 Tax=Aquirhabdus parva TaxID=2283318 RepID=A0A345P6I1_9GAMM|nr:heme exporter protein CcmD [Aquirhabdus parva]AXI02890.1 heme exporter protein CcmD [Aquirhabdus parva]
MNFAFENIHDFIWMGHHGVYVWSAWLISIVSIVLLIFYSKIARQRFYQREQARLRRGIPQSSLVNSKRNPSERSE